MIFITNARFGVEFEGYAIQIFMELLGHVFCLR